MIHKHRATRLHYDVRLERDGALPSWAVPKGLPTAKGDKRMAVRTEDHPLEYGKFEGTIPEAPGAGSEVPSGPNSRRRTYSNSAGSFDASATHPRSWSRRSLRRSGGAGPSGRPRPRHRAPPSPPTGLPPSFAHARPQVADPRETFRHVVDPEVLRLEPAGLDLVPGERCRDRRARLGTQRIRGGDVRPLPVHVVIDEGLAGAVGDPPGHRHAVGVGPPISRPHAPTNARTSRSPATRLDRHVDLQPVAPLVFGSPVSPSWSSRP